MENQEKIRENQKEIHLLKKSNIYSLKKIKESNQTWEKKEYYQVILMNNKRIKELSEHNHKLGGFR